MADNDGVQAFYGTESQRALLRRGADMHLVTRGLPGFTYYGRTVGIASPADTSFDTLVALTRLQGNSNVGDIADDEVEALRARLEAEGLRPMHYRRWEGSDACFTRASALRAPLPGGYRLRWLAPDSPPDLRASLAETALSCGVLPPSLSVLSGDIRPGACAMAVTGEGRVAACAAAASCLDPAHPRGGDVFWWGMLATDRQHRGKALSVVLGAEVMLRMRDVHGFCAAFTGVEPGNAPSEAVCRKLGLAPGGRSILGAADPELVAGGRMTK